MHKVLIIDDNSGICLAVKTILKKIAGWESLTATSGEEGLAIAQRECPDAILLDVRMRGMDGITTLKKIRENSKTQFIPVVLFTSEKLSAQMYEQLPINGVIFKPFEADELVRQMRLLLQWNE